MRLSWTWTYKLHNSASHNARSEDTTQHICLCTLFCPVGFLVLCLRSVGLQPIKSQVIFFNQVFVTRDFLTFFYLFSYVCTWWNLQIYLELFMNTDLFCKWFSIRHLKCSLTSSTIGFVSWLSATATYGYFNHNSINKHVRNFESCWLWMKKIHLQW